MKKLLIIIVSILIFLIGIAAVLEFLVSKYVPMTDRANLKILFDYLTTKKEEPQ